MVDNKYEKLKNRTFAPKRYVKPNNIIEKVSRIAVAILANVWKRNEQKPIKINSSESNLQSLSWNVLMNKRNPIVIKKKLVRALIGSLQKIMLCLSQ